MKTPGDVLGERAQGAASRPGQQPTASGKCLNPSVELAKLLRSRATGCDLRSVAHVQHNAAVELFGCANMIEIDRVRPMDAQKFFGSKSGRKLA